MKKLAAIAVLLAASCENAPEPAPARPAYDAPLPPGQMALEKITDPAQIPDFGAGLHDRDALARAIDESLNFYKKPSSQKRFPYLDVTHKRAVRSLERFREILDEAFNPETFHAALVREFDVYRSVGCDRRGTVYFTGYCEPIFDGSLAPTDEFRFPLYKLPPTLVKDEEGNCLNDWPARGEIEPGLAGLELVYLRDAFEAYIVHVQGSAMIRLADGTMLKLGYAGKTQRPYTSVGKAMVDAGKIARGKLSLTAMKEHFRAHPEDLEILNLNESYVFFATRTGGPRGSINAEVTPYATIATDKAVFPAGATAFLKTSLPDRGDYAGFALDQDTGGAIRSAGRADLFIGTGPEAERLAGTIGSEGRLYYLFVKEVGTARP